MFKIKDFHKNVYADGTIVIESTQKISYVDIVSLAGDNKNQYELIGIEKTSNGNEGDLYFVNNDFKWEDNAIYHAREGVTSLSNNIFIRSPYNCIYEYNNNLLDIYELFKLEVDSKKRKILNRMLYLSILSIYELFMADLSVTCFLRFDKVRDSFRNDTNYSNKSDDVIIESIRNNKYNIFKQEKKSNGSVENQFKNYYDLDIPPSSYLKKAFYKRNDIAHLYNLNKHHNEVVEVKNEEIEELAAETNKFVYELFEKLIGKVYT